MKFNGKKITSLSSHKDKLVNFVEKLEWMTEKCSDKHRFRQQFHFCNYYLSPVI